MIIQTTPSDPATTALLQQSHNLMQSLFNADECHYLDFAALTHPTVTLWRSSDGTGIIALARKSDYAEVKSMFVAKPARGAGLADSLLSHVLEVARDEGIPTLKLETGDVLHAAQRLYARHGFQLCDSFGDYPTHAPRSVYMSKSL